MAGFSLFGVGSHPHVSVRGFAGTGVYTTGQKQEKQDFPLPQQTPPPTCYHCCDSAALQVDSQTETEKNGCL